MGSWNSISDLAGGGWDGDEALMPAPPHTIPRILW
jgi:hypothetical protein